MVIQKIPAAKLKAAAYNPRKDLKPGDAEYEKLKRSIETFGYVEPVIWNKTTGNVVGGHQRLQVLRGLGQTEIDCVVVELDETNEKALNVALNKISGEWDTEKLASLFDGLSASDFDVTQTGFDATEIAAFFDVSDIPDEQKLTREEHGRSLTARVIKFGQFSIPMSEDEWQELNTMAKTYVEANGTAFGFIRLLLGGACQNNEN